MKHPVTLSVGLAALLAAGPVAANDCTAPGQAALDAGKHAAAVTAFEIALENPACGNHRDAVLLGLASAMHGQAEADEDGRRYCDAKQKYILVSESIDAGLAAKGKAGLEAVTAPCDEAWKGSLTVECPSGAEAYIERLGGAKACPATFEGIKAGTYQGELRADGRSAPFIAAVTPGADVKVEAELPAAGGGGGGISTWAWVAAGASLAAFAGAGVAALNTQTIADQANRPENVGDFDTLQDDHGTQATLHYALLGTGVALAGVATWLFLDAGGDEAAADGASAVITPEGFGFGWRGSW